ncbi:MAG: thiol-disulfide oxidoreductase [Rhodovulum sulfidophilum]|uniref:Thiol-disulfide oxidoreductase n=1 Tax=Rhodovulum sulfidophilum TaxID=35806 RepID=A0A2W5NMZ4_RHOSU|nr:MAG: thiol-disulfide oxidoreductase [Rhodovulum sulfidophilum]
MDPQMTLILSRRHALAFGLAATLATPGLSFAQSSDGAAPANTSTKPVGEMAMGDPDAPITMIEYAMFTCPHCADFVKNVYPRIKEDYVDTGKVRLVFREVYFNAPSLWAALIARCAPADRYFGVADLLFETQAGWLNSTDGPTIMKNLYGIGRQAGLTDAQMDACREDTAFAEALVAEYQKHQSADNVDATPLFFINGERFDNAPYEAFQAKFDAILAAEGQTSN